MSAVITCNQEACLSEGRLARNGFDSNSMCINLLIVQMSIDNHSIQTTNIQCVCRCLLSGVSRLMLC